MQSIGTTPVRVVTTAKRDNGVFISLVPGSASSVNLVTNPRAGVFFATDSALGWSAPTVTGGAPYAYAGPHVDRGYLYSPSPPDGDYWFDFTFTPSGGSVQWEMVSDEIAIAEGEDYHFGCWLCGYGNTLTGTIDDYVTVVIREHDASHVQLAEYGWNWAASPECEEEWVRRPATGDEAWDDSGWTAREGCDHVHVVIKYNGNSFVRFGVTLLYVDNVGAAAKDYEYGDGDTDGWTWDGTPHHSTSTKLAVDEYVTRTRDIPTRVVTSVRRGR